MTKSDLDELKLELSIKAKNGIDFILAATILWLGIACIWATSYSAYNKSVLTFIVSSLMLPLAFVLSKIFKTTWALKENPLQPLGLWLNFAQIFYFPFLVFALLKYPDYFLMTYAIITGAHFFPYAWFYNEVGYAVTAGIVSAGALFIGLTTAPANMFIIAVFVNVTLGVLAVWLLVSHKSKVASGNGYLATA